MDVEKDKRRQTIKVLVTEILMVAIIIPLVVILTLIASGYRVNEDMELEQSGLVQISSTPARAEVEIDGETIGARTETSRLLSNGSHKIKLKKEGYDTWEKTVEVQSGWLMRLKYPRLFKIERKTEEVLSIADRQFASVNPARTAILYGEGTSLKLLNVRNEELTEPVEVRREFDREVLAVKWSANSSRVLIQSQKDGAVEWELIEANNPERGVNLTKEYGLEFADLRFVSEVGDRLVGLENGNLREINISGSGISKVLLANVEEWANWQTEVVYVRAEDGKKVIGTYRLGEDDGVELSTIESSDPIKVAISEYDGWKYILYMVGDSLFVSRTGNFPSYDGEKVKMKTMTGGEEVFVPEKINVSLNGEFLVASGGGKLAVFDAELNQISKYDGVQSGWADDYLMAGATDGQVYVWDFDGTNRRKMCAGDTGFVAANNQYFYCISDTILRQKIN